MTVARRRASLTAAPDFEEVAREGAAEGLPPGVSIRWFRSRIARPIAVGAKAGERVPPGAIIWPEGVGDFPEAGAVAEPLPEVADGPRTLPEPTEDRSSAPTVREAVAAAVEALPPAAREGASREVEMALGEVGL